jgi:hypothetical protein
MTIDELRATLRQDPFRPFTMHMVDGRTFRVMHRDYMALSPSGRTVIVFQPDESYSVLDMLLMSELEVPAPNGQPAEPGAAPDQGGT